MREPKIRIGFIIFRPGLEAEIETPKGHWKAARDWVIKKNLQGEYKQINDEKFMDYDDFLTDHIGAIKIHAVRGTLKCYIPRSIPNPYKSFLKRFYRNLGYEIYGDVSEDDDKETKHEAEYGYNYNVTVCKVKSGGSIRYIYNPFRKGD